MNGYYIMLAKQVYHTAMPYIISRQRYIIENNTQLWYNLLYKLEFDDEVISMSKKKNKKKSNWTPPKEYKNYFYASSDEEFKSKHPIGYVFLVMLGIVALLLPAIVFCVLVGTESGWVMLGFAGGFVFGIGLFNFVAIIIKQYLGHWVSIISFLVGGIMMLISWFLCR